MPSAPAYLSTLARYLLVVVFLCGEAVGVHAQDIRTRLTVFDNIGGSTDLTVGININATDAVDAALGEVVLPPPPAGVFDARLIDTDLRSPSLLGNGVLLDLRGIFTPPPQTQTFEVRVRRAPAAAATWIRWTLPLATGISSARLTSYPDPTLLDVDMASISQVTLPAGANRYMVNIVYGNPPPVQYTLNVQVNPPGKGQAFAIPLQTSYVPGQGVILLAGNLPAPDTCYAFSHWSGDASGTSQILNITITGNTSVVANFAPRQQPAVASALDTFVVNTAPPPPQRLYLQGGLACYAWTARSAVPWLRLSKSAGTGPDSIDVDVVTSAIPCPGTHAGTIEITSPFSQPVTLTVPAIIAVGRTGLTADVLGAPTILHCDARAADLIAVTVRNSGLAAVTFPAPAAGDPAFVLKNPQAFPLVVNPMDSATLYYEFSPAANRVGTITDNYILSAAGCGLQVLYQLQGTRSGVAVAADASAVDFGITYDCASEPLPERIVTLRNSGPADAALSFRVSADFSIVSAPASLAAGASGEVRIQPLRSGAAQFSGSLDVTADFVSCREQLTVALTGVRQSASFTAEAVTTPGTLPPQLFDTTCLGTYSQPKNLRIRNNGSAALGMTLTVRPPFEIDAFNEAFTLLPGEERMVAVRFHPTATGTFDDTLLIVADRCALGTSVALRGSTFSQQILTSTVTPSRVTLQNCEESARMLLSVVNTGTQPVRFDTLPALPNGFGWDSAIPLPVIIPPDPAQPFEAYILFQPPQGQSGSFGGSVQWFGSPCGSTVYFSVAGDRVPPLVVVTPQVADFGDIVACTVSGSGPQRTVTVDNNSTIPVLVTASAPAQLYQLLLGATAFPSQGVSINANSSRDITVVALPGGGGAFTDSLILWMVAGSTGACQTRTAVALTGVRSNPSYVVRENGYSTNFGDVCVGKSLTRGYVIENTGDRRLTVSSEGFGDFSAFQLSARPFAVTIEPGTSREFPVRFTPQQIGADIGVLIFSDDVCGDSVTFTVQGRGVQPAMTVTSVAPAGTIDIYTCEIPISRQIIGTLRNSGATPITVTDGSMLPLGFAYDPPSQFPFTIQPGQTHPVVVRFVGTAPGSYAGVVTVYADPCELEAGFPVSVNLLPTAYTAGPQALDFGTVTICPGGIIRPGDLEGMTKTIELRNTGVVPLSVTGALLPNDDAVTIVSPLTWPVSVAAGQTLTVTVAMRQPIDDGLTRFSGTVDLVVSRGSRCADETVSIPFSGSVNRVDFAFAEDSVTVSAGCASTSIELQATLVNNAGMPATFELFVDGPPSFTLADPPTVTLQGGERRVIHVEYTPDPAVPALAQLTATDVLCRTAAVVPLTVLFDEAALTLSSNPSNPAPLQYTARPGDVIEIPVGFAEASPCADDTLTVTFDFNFDGRALAPLRVSSTQGVARFTRSSRDVLSVTVSGVGSAAGEFARISLEVLVGRSASTQWSIVPATALPGQMPLGTDASCAGTLTLKPRNGVATTSDLGITSLGAPKPNLLGGHRRSAQIDFTLREEGPVDIRLYDILGNAHAVIFTGTLARGTHTIGFTPSGLRPGVYFVRMTAGAYRGTQKLILAN